MTLRSHGVPRYGLLEEHLPARAPGGRVSAAYAAAAAGQQGPSGSEAMHMHDVLDNSGGVDGEHLPEAELQEDGVEHRNALQVI